MNINIKISTTLHTTATPKGPSLPVRRLLRNSLHARVARSLCSIQAVKAIRATGFMQRLEASLLTLDTSADHERPNGWWMHKSNFYKHYVRGNVETTFFSYWTSHATRRTVYFLRHVKTNQFVTVRNSRGKTQQLCSADPAYTYDKWVADVLSTKAQCKAAPSPSDGHVATVTPAEIMRTHVMMHTLHQIERTRGLDTSAGKLEQVVEDLGLDISGTNLHDSLGLAAHLGSGSALAASNMMEDMLHGASKDLVEELNATQPGTNSSLDTLENMLGGIDDGTNDVNPVGMVSGYLGPIIVVVVVAWALYEGNKFLDELMDTDLQSNQTDAAEDVDDEIDEEDHGDDEGDTGDDEPGGQVDTSVDPDSNYGSNDGDALQNKMDALIASIYNKPSGSSEKAFPAKIFRVIGPSINWGPDGEGPDTDEDEYDMKMTADPNVQSDDPLTNALLRFHESETEALLEEEQQRIAALMEMFQVPYVGLWVDDMSKNMYGSGAGAGAGAAPPGSTDGGGGSDGGTSTPPDA